MTNYKVWTIINPPNYPVFIPVNGVEEGKELIRKLIKEQLYDPKVISNVFGLVEFINGEWEEWENSLGENIMEVINNEDE